MPERHVDNAVPNHCATPPKIFKSPSDAPERKAEEQAPRLRA